MKKLFIAVLLMSGIVVAVGLFTNLWWEKWALLVFLGLDIFDVLDRRAKLLGIHTPVGAGQVAFFTVLTAEYWLLPQSPFMMRGIAFLFYLIVYVTTFMMRDNQRTSR